MQILSQITLPAILENLPELMQSVSRCAKDRGLAEDKVIQIEIALEEALVNIIKYAYPDRVGDVKVICMIDDVGILIIEIEDAGPPFDLLSVEPPDLAGGISERKIGGLGIHLIRNMIRDVSYLRKDGKNILRLIP